MLYLEERAFVHGRLRDNDRPNMYRLRIVVVVVVVVMVMMIDYDDINLTNTQQNR